MKRASLALTATALLALGALGAGAGEPAEPTPAAAAKPVVLRWQARQQSDVYGYIVYRATRREGPYRRAGSDIVRKRKKGSYVWRDRAVEPGVTYFYYVDVVSTAGRKTRFSGVLQKTVVPRRAPDTPAAGTAADQRSGSPAAGSTPAREQAP